MELKALFEHLCALCGGRVQAYNPIIGAGKDGAVLHFRTGENRARGYGLIEDNSLILIDAAPEFRGYASDLTRTYYYEGRQVASTEAPNSSESWKHFFFKLWNSQPSDERFKSLTGRESISDPKRALLYSMVQKAQQASIDAFFSFAEDSPRDGKLNRWSFVDSVSRRVLTKELYENGFFRRDQVDLETLMATQAVSLFMPHGLGHPIGLDVHDPYDTDADGSGQQGGFAQENFQSDQNERDEGTLMPAGPRRNVGMMSMSDYLGMLQLTDFEIQPYIPMTIEPGLYFIPFILNPIRTGGGDSAGGVPPVPRDWLNWTTVDAFLPLGGVRLEDVVVWTSSEGTDGELEREILTRF